MWSGIGAPDIYPGGVKTGQDSIRLSLAVILFGGFKMPLQDEIGLGQCLIYLALIHLDVNTDIPRLILMNQGGALLHGFLRVKDGRQRLIFYLN